MSVRQHDLAEDLLAETQSDVVQPVYLVDIEFPGDPFYVSSREELEWNGNFYKAHSVEAESIEFSDSGTGPTSLLLSNENSVAAALVLNYGIQGVPITIRKTYVKSDGTLATPRIYFKGEGDDARITSLSVQVGVKKKSARTHFAPSMTFSAANGFNHLLRPGAVIVINGEKYQIGKD